jgi:hypothetical protein
MINALELIRRATLLLGAAAFTSSIARNVEAAQDPERHGVSAFGDLKFPRDFKHFDYVNPNAPKGGVFSHVGATRIFNQNLLTFNSLNSFILRGDAAMGMELTFASLMVRAEDEPDALYGHEPEDALPGARPGDPHWPLLGSALVQGLALAGLLGRVRPARAKTALRTRHPRDLVVRSGQGGEGLSINHEPRLAARGARSRQEVANHPMRGFMTAIS